MRFAKILCAAVLLTLPALTLADARDIPGSADWYLHIDLKQMKSADSGKAIFAWLEEEVFIEVADESGVDFGRELNSLTAFSVRDAGPVLVLDGKFSQDTRDKLMAFIAAEGDISPLKTSGHTYYRLGEGSAFETGDGDIRIQSLEDGGWISMDVRNKIIFAGGEAQMQSLLANKGRVPGAESNGDALLVLTAEKTLLQAGMNSALIGDDSDWDSNILRNTEQVAFLMAAAKNKLALEAKLITSEPELAESLASVARGIISLMAFDDSMDTEAVAVLQSTKIEAKGNALNLSLAVDPDLVVRTIGN